jgi:nucleotide-binding universal stress UspA family protein
VARHREARLHQEHTMFQRILVPTDGSELSKKAIDAALQLAQSVDADVHTVSVKEPFPYAAISEMQPTPPQEFFDVQERMASTRVGEVKAACDTLGLRCTTHTCEALHPWEAIIERAQSQGCDLIVMASHGRRGVTALLLGSETQKVLTHTKIPVLVVR